MPPTKVQSMPSTAVNPVTAMSKANAILDRAMILSKGKDDRVGWGLVRDQRKTSSLRRPSGRRLKLTHPPSNIYTISKPATHGSSFPRELQLSAASHDGMGMDCH
ncbi:hypothetical protein PHYPSEUDO_009519 [Phytophthora pseudosyringae]|uniref:Uncharacterized protein n=1 Tax=Phytophthora pseudosyringae TaxID=221518 RepID=A0A8T1VCI0_9STRA|nr:hypothetical protein PHYPSEUDO_009519 [Phytophthora pseudosyringae]